MHTGLEDIPGGMARQAAYFAERARGGVGALNAMQRHDAAIAMELGCQGVLMNTAIATAKNPVLMASAMKKAVAADPDCSICAWGLAWSLGPTLNYGFVAIDKPAAMAAAENARKLAKPGDERAKLLTEAIVTRFTTEKEPAFGIAMKAIAVMMRPEVDARISLFINYAPANSKSYDTGVIPKEKLPALPNSPENVKKGFVQNNQWWVDNADEMVKRFDAFLQK
jgi:hypothetical protein